MRKFIIISLSVLGISGCGSNSGVSTNSDSIQRRDAVAPTVIGAQILVGSGRDIPNPGDTLKCAHEGLFLTAQGGCMHASDKLVLSSQTTIQVSYENALSYCANLVESGYSDWRLATVNELDNLFRAAGDFYLAPNGVWASIAASWGMPSSKLSGIQKVAVLFDGSIAYNGGGTPTLYPVQCVRQGT